jgi:hypothetical protein
MALALVYRCPSRFYSTTSAKLTMLNPVTTTAGIIADRTTHLAIALAHTTTAAIITQGTGTIDPAGTATGGRAITGRAGGVTSLSVRGNRFDLENRWSERCMRPCRLISCRVIGRYIDLASPVPVEHKSFTTFSRKEGAVPNRPVLITAIPCCIQQLPVVHLEHVTCRRSTNNRPQKRPLLRFHVV